MTPGATYIPTQDDLDNPCRICKTIYDGNANMIQCGVCSKWWHEGCLNDPTIAKLKENENWVCSGCERKASEQGTKPKIAGSARRKSFAAPSSVGPEDQPPRSNVKIDKISRSNLRAIIKTQRQELKTLRNLNKSLSQNMVESKKSNVKKSDHKQVQLSEEEVDDSDPSSDESEESEQEEKSQKRKNKVYKIASSSDESESEEEEFTQKSFARYIAQQDTRELPQFDGTPTQWPSFYSAYQESKSLFSDLANRNRLQKALSGKALKCVSGLLISPTNVREAMKMLKHRFGQSEQIIQESIDLALAAEAPCESKPETIVDYSMLVLSINANIDAVGDVTDKINPMLITLLAQRLPMGLQKQWCRKKRDLKLRRKIVKISTFSRWLLKESNVYVDLLAINNLNENKSSKSSNKQKKPVHIHQNQSTETTKPKKPRVCFKCSSEKHVLPDCDEFKQMQKDQRMEFVIKNHMCFICLRRGHRSRRCYFRRSSDGKHHELIRECENDNAAAGSNKKEVTETTKVHTTAMHKQSIEKVLFKIIPVVLHGPVSQISTYAMLDDGAAVTLLEEDVANKLQLNGICSPLTMGWTKDIQNVEEGSMKVTLSISGTDMKSKKFTIKDVRTVRNLALPVQNCEKNEICSKYPYLSSVGLPDLKRAIPTLLIGLDNANLISPLEMKIDPSGKGPIAMRSKLGWSIHGPEIHDETDLAITPTFLICECQSRADENVEKMVEAYFDLENFGVKTPNKNESDSPEVKIAKKVLETTTKRIGDGFETGLLWRDSVVKMPDNYDMCLRRLVSIEMKMKKDNYFSESYRQKIRDYVDKGYARILSQQEIDKIRENIWFLPHFGISTPNKPKLRLVFDAKATFAGISLNSKLLKGPDCYASMIAVIFKFREGEYAVTADVREMFHQVQIRLEDQRFQCFLWRDGDERVKPDVYVMCAMIFGATCSPCSAQYVKNKNALEFQDGNERAVEAILERFYVDDYLDSFDSEEEALVITKKVIDINKKAKFDLRNVISNSKLVRQHFNISPKSLIDMNVENETEKVLGLHWETESDVFVFKLNFNKFDTTKLESNNLSKREFLRIMMSIYDPLGFLSHYMVRAKILLHEIWLRKYEWDDPLPNDICEKWWCWFTELRKVMNLKIPRNYSKLFLKSNDLHLHVFCDASDRAFSAVAYVRVKFGDEVDVQLIAGKTKIASQKVNKIASMPRLELQGAILAIRLSSLITKAHSVKFSKIVFWTDSQTVLSWLHSQNGVFKPFVAHRVAEIVELSNPKQWKYVPTKENPADDATKTTKHDPFDADGRWFKGPEFLREEEQFWPAEITRNPLIDSDPEVKRIFTVMEHRENLRINCDYSPIDPRKFSCWHDLKRVTAWAKRGLYNWNKRLKNQSLNYLPLSLAEMKEAEFYLIKKAQFESFHEEVMALRNKKMISRKSKIENLIPFLDEFNVMRMDGRIEQSPSASIDMKQPVILSSKHPVTKLILMEFHIKFKHQFQEAQVNEIRCKFWIPKIRAAVKDTKKRCQECRNDRVVPQPPRMAKLPLARVNDLVGCFHYCGVDLFGPMYVTVKRSKEKRWGVIFTCLVVRAIYIDVVTDLTADSLIMSIRNCNSRRGPIKHMFSDCGTNMKGAKTEMEAAKNEISDERIQRECIKNNIEWHYNPPASPHMGGCWERLVRSVKNILGKILKEKAPRDHTLRSFLCEVEDIINSRPLTYIAVENDTDDILTPKHFLNPLFRHDPPPPGEFEGSMASKKQWRIVQEISNHFWKRWVVEYLPMITRTSKWTARADPLEEGDIVIVCDNNLPRNRWQKGVVVGVNKSKDGQTRSAAIKTSTGIFTRPTVKLAKLEVAGLAVNSGEFTGGSVTNAPSK